MNVYWNRNFLLTYAASFISLFGSKLLMMAYVAHIYAERGSATLASIVFAAEWASCLIVGLFGTRYIDRLNAKQVLVALNIIAAFVTLVFVNFTAPDDYYYAIAIIFVRALLSHGVNSARIKALVQFFTKEETNTFSPIFNSSLFIATALAGGVGVYSLGFIDFATIVYLDSATFLIAAAMLAFTRPNKERLTESIQTARNAAAGMFAYIKGTVSLIAENKNLASAVFYIILSVTSFQATYEILMTIVPQIWFDLGKPGTALFFTLESIAVTLGAFLYQYLHRRGLITDANHRALNAFTLTFAAAVYLLIPRFQHDLYLCLAAFNIMIIAVELIWTHQFKQMIAHAPTANVSGVTGVQMAMGYSLMGVFALAFSKAVDRWGISTAIYLNILLLALLVGSWLLMTKDRTAQSDRVAGMNEGPG